MLNVIQYIILIPVLSGLMLFLLPERISLIKKIIALVTVLAALYFSLLIFLADENLFRVNDLFGSKSFTLLGANLMTDAGRYVVFQIDSLSKLISICIGFFGLVLLCYSIGYNKTGSHHYYSYFLITLGSSFGAVLADNLLVFVTCWGLLGITLYKLIPGDGEESSAAAKKTLILIGASDGIMILGIAIIWMITGTLNISSISLTTTGALSVTAFLALITGSFTKAGAFPFHTWVPDFAGNAPASSSAFLPASLDKLLGIYFLARITTEMFTLTDAMRLILLSLGAITIIAAVMMALMQHDFKRLLGYHAVSQVGYMIVGFGLGTFIGVAAGLFHMLNNALYKSGLFLAAGNVEIRTGKKGIDELGGLSRSMPLTFVASLIFSLSISGIPPFNGFASKWMIYQGIIDFGSGTGAANKLWIVWLAFAVLGSALTLASFVKFMGGIFMGRQKPELMHVKEVPALMWAPPMILALVCTAFGVFATGYIVPRLFMPVSGNFQFTGFWNSAYVSALVLVSFFLGMIFYLISSIKEYRTEDSFIGGEVLREQTGYPATEFYKGIRDFRPISWLYDRAEAQWFDIYHLFRRMTLWGSGVLSAAHNGVLPVYMIWIFSGLIIMVLILL